MYSIRSSVKFSGVQQETEGPSQYLCIHTSVGGIMNRIDDEVSPFFIIQSQWLKKKNMWASFLNKQPRANPRCQLLLSTTPLYSVCEDRIDLSQFVVKHVGHNCSDGCAFKGSTQSRSGFQMPIKVPCIGWCIEPPRDTIVICQICWHVNVWRASRLIVCNLYWVAAGDAGACPCGRR